MKGPKFALLGDMEAVAHEFNASLASSAYFNYDIPIYDDQSKMNLNEAKEWFNSTNNFNGD